MDKKTFDTLRERFDANRNDAVSDVIERITAHFAGDKWTLEQLETVWGKHIISFDGLTDEEYKRYKADDYFMDIEDALDSIAMEDTLNSEDFNFDSLVKLADEFGVDLDGVTRPYKFIFFTPDVDPDKYDFAKPIEDIDEDKIDPEDVAEYVICDGRDEMLEVWEGLYKHYEGRYYYVKDDAGILVGGAMDINDLDTLENFRSFLRDPKLVRQDYINGVLEHFFDENGTFKNKSDEELKDVYGLEVVCTDGCSAEEYEEIYNDDTVVTDKNAKDMNYMKDTLCHNTDQRLIELYSKYADTSKVTSLENARDMIKSVENGFASFYNAVTDGVKTPAILKKDPSIEGVYEFWIKMGADNNNNGGKIIGKIYDLNGDYEVSKALEGIESGFAVLSTSKGRMSLEDTVKYYEDRQRLIKE